MGTSSRVVLFPFDGLRNSSPTHSIFAGSGMTGRNFTSATGNWQPRCSQARQLRQRAGRQHRSQVSVARSQTATDIDDVIIVQQPITARAVPFKCNYFHSSTPHRDCTNTHARRHWRSRRQFFENAALGFYRKQQTDGSPEREDDPEHQEHVIDAIISHDPSNQQGSYG